MSGRSHDDWINEAKAETDGGSHAQQKDWLWRRLRALVDRVTAEVHEHGADWQEDLADAIHDLPGLIEAHRLLIEWTDFDLGRL